MREKADKKERLRKKKKSAKEHCVIKKLGIWQNSRSTILVKHEFKKETEPTSFYEEPKPFAE